MTSATQDTAERPRPAGRIGAGNTIAIAVALLFLLSVYPVTRLASPPMTSLGPVVGYAAVDGEEAVLLAYGRSGGNGVASRDHWQERAAAVSLASGELLWDVQLHDHAHWDRGVLAVADGLAYVATDYGLTVLSADDGSTVAGVDEIGGIGEDYAEAYAAYDTDPALDAVVALTRSGDIMQIPLGTTEAEPVPADKAEAWRGTLHTETAPTYEPSFAMIDVDPAAVPHGMALADGGTITISSPHESTTAVLSRTAADGTGVYRAELPDLALADLVYEIVVTPAALATPEQVEEGIGIFTRDHSAAVPLGVDSGIVLVHGRHPDDPGVDSLRLVAVDTGATLASVRLEDAYLRATATPGGDIMVMAPEEGAIDHDRLLLFRPDGTVLAVDVGETDFWGSAITETTVLS